MVNIRCMSSLPSSFTTDTNCIVDTVQESCILILRLPHVDTAMIKHPSDGKWYDFNDSLVKPASEAQLVDAKSSVYIFFYRKKAPSAQ